MSEEFVELDIQGQQPAIQIYTQLSFCFPLSSSTNENLIIETLENGFKRLINSFPWVGGHVINESSSDKSSGVYKIKISKSDLPRISIKDLKNDPNAPTWDSLIQEDFPMKSLDEDLIAPRQTLPLGDDASLTKYVFIIQLNLINGGIIITFNGHHAVMDIQGQSQLIHLFNTACKGEPFSKEQLIVGNGLIRKSITTYDKDYELNGEVLGKFLIDQNTIKYTDLEESPISSSWCYFAINNKTSRELVEEANKEVRTGFVSSDDCVSAFIWQSVTRARSHRLDKTGNTKFGRAIDMRKLLGLNPNYPGLILTMSFQDFKIDELINKPLGLIAIRLRQELNNEKLIEQTKTLATYLERNSDKSTVSIVAKINSSTDIQISSWSKVNAYDVDFNLNLGFPKEVIRPKFTPCESLIYFMPKKPNGDIKIAISIRDEDFEKLKNDPLFLKYASVIG